MNEDTIVQFPHQVGQSF